MRYAWKSDSLVARDLGWLQALWASRRGVSCLFLSFFFLLLAWEGGCWKRRELARIRRNSGGAERGSIGESNLNEKMGAFSLWMFGLPMWISLREDSRHGMAWFLRFSDL